MRSFFTDFKLTFGHYIMNTHYIINTHYIMNTPILNGKWAGSIIGTWESNLAFYPPCLVTAWAYSRVPWSLIACMLIAWNLVACYFGRAWYHLNVGSRRILIAPNKDPIINASQMSGWSRHLCLIVPITSEIIITRWDHYYEMRSFLREL